MKKEIRYYQQEAIDAIDASLKRGVKNQLLCMATGTGKTFTAVKAVKNKGRVLWGTHEEGLLEQSATAAILEMELMTPEEVLFTLDSYNGLVDLIKQHQKSNIFVGPAGQLIYENVGVVKADVFDIEKPFVFASMQTLHNRLGKILPNHFDVVVADECHLFGAPTFKKSLDYFDHKLRLGLSATPFREDGMLMGDLFDEIVYEYTIDQGIKDGYLCEIDAIRIKTNVGIDDVHTRGGELKKEELEQAVNTFERNRLVIDKYFEYCKGRQFIAYTVDVQHCKDLADECKNQGLNVAIVVGDKEITPERKKVYSDFRAGLYDGLVNVNVLVAGSDFPNVGAILMACPTKSKVKFLQSIGRGTRLKNEAFVAKFGQNCIILDFIDNTSKHRLVNTWELDKAKPIEERTFVTKENKLKLIFERERRIKLQSYDKDKKVDLLQLPVVEISGSYRMQEPATEKQLQWIKSLGYDIDNVHYTKEMCTRIIMNLPASDKQIWVLRKAGYDVSKGVTRAEATAAFEAIKKKEAKEMTKKLKAEGRFPFNDVN